MGYWGDGKKMMMMMNTASSNSGGQELRQVLRKKNE